LELILIVIFFAVAAIFFFAYKASQKRKIYEEKLVRDAVSRAAQTDKKARPLFHLPPERLMKIQYNLDFVVAKEWRNTHPLEDLPWDTILGDRKDQLIGLAGQGFSNDVSILSYATVLGCLAERDRDFFNSEAHKGFERQFVQTERDAVKLGPMHADLFGVHFPEGGKSPLSNVPTRFRLMMQRISQASYRYSDVGNSTASEEQRLVQLLDATILIKIISDVSDGRAMMLSLVQELRDAATSQIDQSIDEFLKSQSE